MLLLHAPICAAEDTKPLLSEVERFNALKDLNWQKSETYDLPFSHSTIHLPANYNIVIGKDAYKAMEFMGNPDSHSVEAVVYNDDFKETVVFSSHDGGYVSLRDWDAVNPDQLLADIKKHTEFVNKERKKRGIGSLDLIGWLQKPTLNRETNTVYWAIEAKREAGTLLVNSFALRLGRNGYETITWVTDKASYASIGGELEIMLKAYSFKPGFDYSDHAFGDMCAKFGIAGLVASILGAKVVKSTGLLFFLKKIWVLIVAALAALIYKLKNIFGSNDEE